MEPQEYQNMAAEEDRMWWYRATRTCMLRYLLKFKPESGRLILDSGCGTGGYMKMVMTALPDHDFIGLELNEWASETARAKSSCPVIRGSVDHLPFADKIFSAINSTDVLYHLNVDEQQTIAESYRCLSSGGVYIVQVPAYQWLSSTHDKRVFGVRRYTRDKISHLLSCAGFTILHATYRNTFVFPLMVLQRKVLKSVDDDSDVKSFPAIVERLFNLAMSLEQFVLDKGFSLPFGGSIVVVGVKNDQ